MKMTLSFRFKFILKNFWDEGCPYWIFFLIFFFFYTAFSLSWIIIFFFRAYGDVIKDNTVMVDSDIKCLIGKFMRTARPAILAIYEWKINCSYANPLFSVFFDSNFYICMTFWVYGPLWEISPVNLWHPKLAMHITPR